MTLRTLSILRTLTGVILAGVALYLMLGYTPAPARVGDYRLLVGGLWFAAFLSMPFDQLLARSRANLPILPGPRTPDLPAS